MKTVLFLLVGLLACIGLGYLLAAVQRWILRPCRPSRVAVVLPVFAGDVGVEQNLRSAYTELLSGEWGEAPFLVVADFDADEETKAVCGRFCSERSFAHICRGEELPGILRSLQE